MMKSSLLALLLAGFALLLGSCEQAEAACDPLKDPANPRCKGLIKVEPAAALPCIAPDCLPELDLLDSFNEVHPAESLKGKVVVINFWATWCGPCKEEIPAFNRVYDKFKDRGVLMFGLNTENISNIDLLNFQSDWEMTFPAVHMDDRLAAQYGVPSNIPTTFIYDKRGVRVTNRLGGLDEAELSAILEQLVAQ